jgi:hypothetical protein
LAGRDFRVPALEVVAFSIILASVGSTDATSVIVALG